MRADGRGGVSHVLGGRPLSRGGGEDPLLVCDDGIYSTRERWGAGGA